MNCFSTRWMGEDPGEVDPMAFLDKKIDHAMGENLKQILLKRIDHPNTNRNEETIGNFIMDLIVEMDEKKKRDIAEKLQYLHGQEEAKPEMKAEFLLHKLIESERTVAALRSKINLLENTAPQKFVDSLRDQLTIETEAKHKAIQAVRGRDETLVRMRLESISSSVPPEISPKQSSAFKTSSNNRMLDESTQTEDAVVPLMSSIKGNVIDKMRIDTLRELLDQETEAKNKAFDERDEAVNEKQRLSNQIQLLCKQAGDSAVEKQQLVDQIQSLKQRLAEQLVSESKQD